MLKVEKGLAEQIENQVRSKIDGNASIIEQASRDIVSDNVVLNDKSDNESTDIG